MPRTASSSEMPRPCGDLNSGASSAPPCGKELLSHRPLRTLHRLSQGGPGGQGALDLLP